MKQKLVPLLCLILLLAFTIPALGHQTQTKEGDATTATFHGNQLEISFKEDRDCKLWGFPFAGLFCYNALWLNGDKTYTTTVYLVEQTMPLEVKATYRHVLAPNTTDVYCITETPTDTPGPRYKLHKESCQHHHTSSGEPPSPYQNTD